MFNRRKLTVQVRMSQEEREIIEQVAAHMRRSCSDALRVLALEKAEVLGLPGGSINLPPPLEIVINPEDVHPVVIEVLRRAKSADDLSSQDELTPEDDKEFWDNL